jgi:hypothetical protein
MFFAGQKLTAYQLNSAAPTGEVQSAVNTTFGQTTSTSYTPTLSGSSAVTLAFTVPPSGSIAVFLTASILPGNSGQFGTISVALSGAAGVVAASDAWQAFVRSTDAANAYHGTVFRETIFPGLVAGATGLITMNHRSSSGTVDFSNRQLRWRPVAA